MVAGWSVTMGLVSPVPGSMDPVGLPPTLLKRVRTSDHCGVGTRWVTAGHSGSRRVTAGDRAGIIWDGKREGRNVWAKCPRMGATSNS